MSLCSSRGEATAYILGWPENPSPDFSIQCWRWRLTSWYRLYLISRRGLSSLGGVLHQNCECPPRNDIDDKFIFDVGIFHDFADIKAGLGHPLSTHTLNTDVNIIKHPPFNKTSPTIARRKVSCSKWMQGTSSKTECEKVTD